MHNKVTCLIKDTAVEYYCIARYVIYYTGYKIIIWHELLIRERQKLYVSSYIIILYDQQCFHYSIIQNFIDLGVGFSVY